MGANGADCGDSACALVVMDVLPKFIHSSWDLAVATALCNVPAASPVVVNVTIPVL